MMFLVICMTAMAQNKLTHQAQLSIERQKAKTARKANGAFHAPAQEESGLMTFVVKVDKKDATRTFDQIKAVGATIKSRLGQQVVISIPIDSVNALEQIEGVLRIDKGHKGRRKTDVTRQETGVSLLNGPALPSTSTAYTGKDVTICLIDAGFDFQHPAFKDAEGRSRIKCVYMMGDNGGNKFSVSDPEAGDYTFPGSVYDTPELISTLTTDDTAEYHGSHTAGIAAGSISPQGFGGMAPEADLVLIPLGEVEVEGIENEDSPEEYMELALAFATAYAKKSQKPTVLSVSANSHAGPHDGTSSVTEAIEAASEALIPVFSTGNEGGYPVHLYRKFTAAKPSLNTILIGLFDDDSGEYKYLYYSSVSGYTRTGTEVSVQLKLLSINALSGKTTPVWTSEKCTATPGCEDVVLFTSSEDDPTLAKYFEGTVAVAAEENDKGQLMVGAYVDGGMKKLYLFQLTVSGADGTEIDLWDDAAGFGGVHYVGLSGTVDGDSDMSAGDWTSTSQVVSVGAWCANVLERDYDGSVTDTSVSEDPDDDVIMPNDIGWFSSYGTSFNGVAQPVVCAPGVNVVSAFNHYYTDGDDVADAMQWEGFPYGAETGTSMACPVVAGIVALWLQANPSLTIDDVKDVMAHSSINDEYTAASPIRWGYGKISADQGIEYIINGMTGIKAVDNASTTFSDAIYDLQGRRVATLREPGNTQLQRGIYIYKGKKLYVK